MPEPLDPNGDHESDPSEVVAPPASKAPPSDPPSTPSKTGDRTWATGCHSAFYFGELRRRQRVVPSFERAMVCHLAAPCATCLGRLASLPPLAPPDAKLGEPPDLLPTDSALLRALRTVGGWPPSRWLQVDRRRALENIFQPFGFFWLVVEEARQLAVMGSSARLAGWVEVLAAMVGHGRDWPFLRPVMARALAYQATREQPRETAFDLFDLFDRAAQLADQHSEDRYLAALMGETYGQLTERLGGDFASGQYHLARARLIHLGDAARRAEILLRQARGRVRQGDTDAARQLARRALDTLDRAKVPLVERSAHQLRALARLAEVDTTEHGLPRLLAAALLAGEMALLEPLSPLVDGELSHEFARMLCRLEELGEQHRGAWLEAEVLPGALHDRESEAMVRAVLASETGIDHRPTRGAAEHFARLVELARDPAIAARLVALRPEVVALRDSLRGVRGLPEQLAPLAEVLRRLEGQHAGGPRPVGRANGNG